MKTVTRMALTALPCFCLSLVCFEPVAHAACVATTVTKVLSIPAQCGGLGAFQSAGSGANWICFADAANERLAIAAYLSGRNVSYQLGSGDADCNPGNSYSSSKTPVYFFLE